MIWLYPRVGRMKQILSCDWLPKGARWTHLAGHLEFPILVPEEKVVYGYNYSKSFIDQAYSIKVAVDIGLIRFCVFMDQRQSRGQ